MVRQPTVADETAFDIGEVFPTLSVVLIAKACVVPQMSPPMVIPVLGGRGSPAAWLAPAQSASVKVLPTRYRTSKLALPEPLSGGLLQVRDTDVLVLAGAARLPTAAGAALSILTAAVLIASTLPTLSIER